MRMEDRGRQERVKGEGGTLRKWEGGGERDFCDYIVLSGEKS